MKTINPRKLLNSKWTAVSPRKKEKHFLVTEVEFNEEGDVLVCTIEAVISSRATSIQWHELEDTNKWLHGWK
ncbi:MAG: TIGR02450 family Trp-rich protein [Halioglobus sp.]|nr:TIGR02450 family Trp-rich protein [Halioglobus sp.]